MRKVDNGYLNQTEKEVCGHCVLMSVQYPEYPRVNFTYSTSIIVMSLLYLNKLFANVWSQYVLFLYLLGWNKVFTVFTVLSLLENSSK